MPTTYSLELIYNDIYTYFSGVVAISEFVLLSMKLVTTFPLKVTVNGHFFSRGENVWSLNYPHSAIFSSFIRHFFLFRVTHLEDMALSNDSLKALL